METWSAFGDVDTTIDHCSQHYYSQNKLAFSGSTALLAPEETIEFTVRA